MGQGRDGDRDGRAEVKSVAYTLTMSAPSNKALESLLKCRETGISENLAACFEGSWGQEE